MKISSPRHLIRRENLLILIHEFGGATALATLCGTPKSHVSAMLSGQRGMGDDLAAKLERRTEKPTGWMDVHHPEAAALLELAAAGRAGATRPDPSAPNPDDALSEPRSLSRRQQALLEDFDDIPPDEQDKLLADLHRRAEFLRKFALQLVGRREQKAPLEPKA